MTQIRVATYNIHKGVQGLGPARRLEIHNLGHAVEQFDADIVCLQEVRKLHRREAAYFKLWPEQAWRAWQCHVVALAGAGASARRHVGPPF